MRDKPSINRPLLYNSGTYATLLCFRRPFVTTPPYNRRQGNLYPISPVQKEALDTVHYTAHSLRFAIKLDRGDISFTNNLRVLHARESFRDAWPPRHIQRLIVREPSERYKLPVGLTDIWRQLFGDGDPEKPKNESFRPENAAGDPLFRLNG
ncbi:hypothetical protein GP486_006276 [Trichoglossum hirsutum]|uniref:TauD/TfdA-like domain-containing protein n=1 Tax=Trichoglossum hirsutum TaxID=265104 RepID=A0A9P8L5Q0_9PEZI|nr:hypothetical protein GP486_006276 [Trichoglossum hirsutum]